MQNSQFLLQPHVCLDNTTFPVILIMDRTSETDGSWSLRAWPKPNREGTGCSLWMS
ncbi:rCG20346 [Rattus norvegicus]|uniref:RCG20346 n=1 Tax=Rattus norvegicus TaxID=10116 RepID=A6JH24_RAT|nr:rCG20346 [Rattus norvegicus]